MCIFSDLRRGVSSPASRIALASLAFALTGCASAEVAPAPEPPDQDTQDASPRVVQPGAPGEPVRVLERGEIEAGRPGPSEADVRFMQAMIGHHGQALEMSAQAPERTRNEGLLRLARRIEVSQRSEIELMRRWLERRGKAGPADPGSEHAGDPEPAMLGMLSPEEMRSLEEAEGATFDRLFLDLMIRHHEGALMMVDELLGAPGAAQDVDVFQMAAHVEADQAAEIARMRAMRAAMD